MAFPSYGGTPKESDDTEGVGSTGTVDMRRIDDAMEGTGVLDGADEAGRFGRSGGRSIGPGFWVQAVGKPWPRAA